MQDHKRGSLNFIKSLSASTTKELGKKPICGK